MLDVACRQMADGCCNDRGTGCRRAVRSAASPVAGGVVECVQVVPDMAQRLHQALALRLAHASQGAGFQLPPLAPNCAGDRPAFLRELESDLPPIVVCTFAFNQTAFSQAFDQSGDLRLVAADVFHKIAQGVTRPAGQMAQHFAFHVRQPIGRPLECTQLLHAELMHHRVNQFQHALILGGIGGFVDNINGIPDHVDIINKVAGLRHGVFQPEFAHFACDAGAP